MVPEEDLQRLVDGILSEDEIRDIFQQILGEEYKNIREFAEGKTKICFLAEYEGETRVIKIDKDPEGDNARATAAKGYNSLHDGKMRLGISHPDDHNILRVLHCRDLGKFTILVEDYFPSKTLEEKVKKEGPLSDRNFKKVFSGVMEAATHTNRSGMYHRDINPLNILVDEEYKTMATDFTNACYKGQSVPKILPTFGARRVFDPLLGGEGKTQYGDGSEAYEIGASMFFSLTGKYAFSYDPFSRQGRKTLRSPKLMEKHNKKLDEALAALPKDARKYSNIIRRCMTLNKDERYKSIEELAADFEAAGRPGFCHRAKRYTLPAAAAVLLGAAAVAGAVSLTRRNAEQEMAAFAEDAKIFNVVTGCNGEDLEIVNNLAELDFEILQKNKIPEKRSKRIYPITAPKDDWDWKPYLEFNGGETLTVFVRVHEKLLPKSVSPPTLAGKLYFEGIPGDHRVSVYPGPQDKSKYYASEGMWGSEMADVQVPEGLPDGVYYFVGEFYAPVKGDSRMGEKNIRFDKPGGILMRKRIPVVIGNPEYSISLSRIITGIPEQYVMKNLGEKRPRDDVEYEFSMPELGIKDTSRGRTNHIYGLVETPCNRDINDGTFDPSALEGREYFIAQIVARHKGNVIGCHFFPMRPEFVGKNKDPFLLWNLHTPGKEYQEKLVEMREKIMSSSRRVSSDF